MTMFDLIVIVILLISTGLAIVRGALLEFATLIILGLSWLLAVQFSPAVLSALGQEKSMLGILSSYAIVMGISFLVLYVICHLLLRRFSLTNRADQINRIAGGLFGFVRGYVLIGLGFLAYGYYLDEAEQHESVRKALFRPLAESGANFFEQFVPESTRLDRDIEDEAAASAPSAVNDVASDGYGRAERAGLSEVITTVTTGDAARPINDLSGDLPAQTTDEPVPAQKDPEFE